MPAPDSSSTATRLAIVVSHPTQYYSPWFRHLAQEAALCLRVFYLWDFGVTHQRDERFATVFQWDIDLTSGYDHEFVPNTAKNPGTHHFNGLRNPALLPRLRAWAPDAVLLFGYAYRSNLAVMRTARRTGWRLLFRGDSHLLGHPRPSGFKRLLLGHLFRRIDTALYVGHANRAYFEYFGVPPSRLRFCPHAVDGVRFAVARNPEFRARARAAANVAVQQHVFLFAGKFHPDKAPLPLLEAFLDLQLPNTVLVLAGDGEQREALMHRAQNHADRVRFLPFANQSQMPARYALADVFILPSEGLYETWGLAVNEAMHAGCPCIVSDRVGCQQDLVHPGRTGWVFPAKDPAALRRVLREAYQARLDDARWICLGERVHATISGYTYVQASEALNAALHP